MNLQKVQEAEQDLLRFASAFRSAKDLADAIAAAKHVIVGIDEYEKKLAGIKAAVEAAQGDLVATKRELADAQTGANRAKAELATAKEELANLASKLFGGR